MGRREPRGFSSGGSHDQMNSQSEGTFCLEFPFLSPLPTTQLGNVLELVLAQKLNPWMTIYFTLSLRVSASTVP